MKCCTLEVWFTCGETGNEHRRNKIMSEKDMSKLISEALEFIQIGTQIRVEGRNEEMKLSA
jgi:hypothetical protein